MLVCSCVCILVCVVARPDNMSNSLKRFYIRITIPACFAFAYVQSMLGHVVRAYNSRLKLKMRYLKLLPYDYQPVRLVNTMFIFYMLSAR